MKDEGKLATRPHVRYDGWRTTVLLYHTTIAIQISLLFETMFHFFFRVRCPAKQRILVNSIEGRVSGTCRRTFVI